MTANAITYNSVFKLLVQLIEEEECSDIPIEATARLEDLGVDSFTLLNLVVRLEKELGRTLELSHLVPEDIETLERFTHCYINHAC